MSRRDARGAVAGERSEQGRPRLWSLLLATASALGVSACRPEDPEAPPPPCSVAAPVCEAIPVASAQLAGVLRAARSAAAAEIVSIAFLLPAGDRDGEAAWLLRWAEANEKSRLIPRLDIPEVVRLRVPVRECARSKEWRERDAAIVALARAGEVDVLPLIADGLRREDSEGSLVALARAARDLGVFGPLKELKEALVRARSSRALAEITGAIGSAVDAGVLRSLGARGASGMRALDVAVRALRHAPRIASWETLGLTNVRCRELLDGCTDPAAASELCRLADRGVTRFGLEQMLGGDIVYERDPVADLAADARRDAQQELPGSAIAALHARAAALMGEDRERCSLAVRELARRVRSGSRDAELAAIALGEIGAQDAVAALALALFEVEEERVVGAISSALVTALSIGPERVPEDASELRRLWAPILQTWFDLDQPGA